MALRGYWKQFVGWVTGLKNKWQDPFIKSKTNIILLQIFFAIVLFILCSIFFQYLYRDILVTVIAQISANIATGDANTADEIISSVAIVRSNSFLIFLTIFATISVLFTLLVAKTTLRPARDALKLQKRFISDIAHELRTPLSVIKTNSEVALMDNDLNGKARKMAESNIEELDRMSEIINNLLSFNNLVRPEKISFNNVDMSKIIDVSISKLTELAGKKHLVITTKKISPHIVWGNAVALEQIVTNLLKNAINYTQEHGHITIKVGPDYFGSVLLHVEDTGVGITKEDLVHIFEPFFRAERSRNRGKGSSGLGLAIVSELVKIHSGRITIKSAENKGTVAIVTLPYGKKENAGETIELAKLNEISVNYLEDQK